MTPANGEGPRIAAPFEFYTAPDTESDAPRRRETTKPRAARHGLIDRMKASIPDVRDLLDRSNNCVTRAVARYFSGFALGAPGVAGLIQMPDADPGDDRLFFLALIIGSALAVAWLFSRNWVNAGRGAIFGAGLWVLSGIWWMGITMIVGTAWQYVMVADPDNASSEALAIIGIGVVVAVASSFALRRLDPDD